MGLAIAESLAAEGANVAMFARRRELLEREAERLGALAVRGDVTNSADLKRLVTRTLEAFGGIDILVNNSGGPPRTPAVGLTDEQVESAVELLLLSAIRLTALCLAQLERSGRGRVINIESSSVKEPIDNLALSNAVRPGVVGWAKSLAREVGSRRSPSTRSRPAGSRPSAWPRPSRASRGRRTSRRSRSGASGSRARWLTSSASSPRTRPRT